MEVLYSEMYLIIKMFLGVPKKKKIKFFRNPYLSHVCTILNVPSVGPSGGFLNTDAVVQ